MALQFFEKAIEIFGTTMNIKHPDPFFGQNTLNESRGFFDIHLSFSEIGFLKFFGMGKVFRIKILEAKVFELAFNFTDTEAVR